MNRELPLIKSGTTTGLTRGLFKLNGTQVRIAQDGNLLTDGKSEFQVMKGQYEVEKCGNLSLFFVPGDSGSAVFMKDESGNLTCVGMAIGTTSYGNTVVTPIKAVLEALSLDENNVMQFFDKMDIS